MIGGPWNWRSIARLELGEDVLATARRGWDWLERGDDITMTIRARALGLGEFDWFDSSSDERALALFAS